MANGDNKEQGAFLQLLKSVTKGQFASFFALLIVVFGMGYMTLLTFWSVPEPNQPYVNTILGFVLGTMVATSVAYVLGSSKGSADKNKLLAEKTSATVEPGTEE